MTVVNERMWWINDGIVQKNVVSWAFFLDIVLYNTYNITLEKMELGLETRKIGYLCTTQYLKWNTLQEK